VIAEQNAPDFYGCEKTISEFGNIRKQDEYPFLHAGLPECHAAFPRRLAVGELRIGDRWASHSMADTAAAAFAQMAVDKIRG